MSWEGGGGGAYIYEGSHVLGVVGNDKSHVQGGGAINFVLGGGGGCVCVNGINHVLEGATNHILGSVLRRTGM